MKVNLTEYSQGEIMKIIREWTDLTQEEFAKEMGKSKRTIEDYEAGRVNYNIQFIKKLMDNFDIEVIIKKK